MSKSTNSTLSAPFALKVAGYALILFSVINYAALLFPLQWQEDKWLGPTIVKVVDLGMFPLIGMVFVYLSSYLENQSLKPQGRDPLKTGRFVALVFSGLLGVIFLLSIPVNVVTTNKIAATEKDLVEKQAKQKEDEIQLSVQQRLGQLQEQIKDKAKLDAELKQISDAVASGQVSGQKIEPAQIEQLKKSLKDLQKLKEDPNHLQTMAKDATEQDLIKVRDIRDKAKKKFDDDALKTILRTGLGGLLLATSFGLIVGIGFQDLGGSGKR